MDPDHTFSPAFLYHKINRGVDEGATLIEAFEYLCQHGCATMAEMPYDPADFKTQPTEDAINDAERFGLRSFYSINPFQIKDIKRYLRAGDPIVVGAKIDGSFMSLKGKKSWMDYSSDGMADPVYHAMLVTGYDDDLGFESTQTHGYRLGR